MAIREQILADIKTAMKAKDEVTLNTLRFLNSAIKNKEIEVRPNELTEKDVISVIKKSVKQRGDSIEQYGKAGRSDLVEAETAELKVLEKYLPKSMDREQVEKIVVETIASLGATSMKQMGAVMKEVQVRTAGAADNRMVSELVKEKLS